MNSGKKNAILIICMAGRLYIADAESLEYAGLVDYLDQNAMLRSKSASVRSSDLFFTPSIPADTS